MKVPKKEDRIPFASLKDHLRIALDKKPKLLFLDDRSNRLHGALKKYGDDYDVTLVCTVKECIKMLSNEGPWNVVSLDHDLDFDEFVPSILPNTGMEVVRWITENNVFLHQRQMIGLIIIHTSNQAAAHMMANRLFDAGFEHIIERFTYDD